MGHLEVPVGSQKSAGWVTSLKKGASWVTLVRFIAKKTTIYLHDYKSFITFVSTFPSGIILLKKVIMTFSKDKMV